MALIEIERKFLVKSEIYKAEASKHTQIKQGYLNSDPNRTVRIRIYGKKGFLTIKGASDASGTTRFEWETQIELDEAEALLKLCEPGVIDKTRYEVKVGEHLFEVDEFYDANEGLIVAEIELNDTKEDFISPDWLGEEVTGDVRYYNSQLSKNPFIKW
ncbi:MAG: CYTH domain-containing protein [Leeuwenhoekiella sp.]